MKVLVTGGAGFIGSHLVDALLARGDEVRVLDNFDPVYDPALKRARVRGEVLEGDVRDADIVARALDGVHAIAHLAARAGVRQSFDDPAGYQAVNVAGTANLLARRDGRPMVFASSSSVYGVRRGEAFGEDDPVAPASPYAASKAEAEASCQGVAVVRLFTVYGPRQRPGMAMERFTNQLRAGTPVTLYGDGTSVRDYTFVSDAVDGLLRALAHGAGTFNIAGGRAVPLMEVVTTLAEVLGVTLHVAHLPDQPGDVPETRADLTRAATVLGYRPQVELREGLARYVAIQGADGAARPA
jgi:UDP-glucuronate 4-epimerase